MRSSKPEILLVEDDKNTRDGLFKYLSECHYDVNAVDSAEAAIEALTKHSPEIVLTDLKLPKATGLDLLKHVKKLYPNIIVILLTAYGTVDNAVEAMKLGAYDYLNKPVNLDELEHLLERAVDYKDTKEENVELKNVLNEKIGAHELVYKSKIMVELISTAKRVASTSATVLLQGESGTGKELFAQMIHNLSPRRNHAFIAVHCASLAASLLESELFGHEKGSFTGASQRRIGRFERAHQGTLFLDEVGEIKEETQVKLLRAIQEGEFERVGGTNTIKSDIRFIAATNRDLQADVKSGRFREDLFYRLNVIALDIPPLRDRTEDIAPLITHFVEHYSSKYNKDIRQMSAEAKKVLEQYSWPGNVRELENIVERMVVLARANELTVQDVPKDIVFSSRTLSTGISLDNSAMSLQDAEKALIEEKIKQARGNKSRAAKLLGISRRTLYRKLKEYRLEETI